MIISRPLVITNEAHRFVQNELRPRRLARPKLHRLMLPRPAGSEAAGATGMAPALLVALFSLLVRAAVTAASCACSTAPRAGHCKRAQPAGN
jgi:hypothetical protein